MGIKELVNAIAKATVLTDAGDLSGLVQLQEQFEHLSKEIEAAIASDGATTIAPLLDVSQSACSLLGEIILRQTDGTGAAFQLIQNCVEQAQAILDGSAAPTQGDDANAANDIDEELLEAWISGCRDQLASLETTLVEIEHESDPEALIADARRVTHTIKGEAGVLSLRVAQRLFHDAESAIDECIDHGAPFPVDVCLMLVDWLKSYVDLLANDPTATPPEYAEIDSALHAFSDSPDAPTKAAAPAETAAPVEAAAPAETAAPVATSAAPVAEGPVVFPDDLGMDENLNDFLCEAREHIVSAEEALLALEDTPEDQELIGTVFRGFHTIKGVAGFMNLVPVVELAHDAETLLDKARNCEITLDSAYLELILQSCDLLTSLVAQLEGEPAPAQQRHNDLRHLLQAAVNGQAPTPAAAPEAPAGVKEDEFHPLGSVLVGLGLCTSDDVDSALTRQHDGSLELRAILLKAGLVDTDAVEKSLLSGDDIGRLIGEHLINLEFVTQSCFEEAISAARDGKKRLGELLGLTDKDIANALHEQRAARREDGVEPTPKAAPAAPAKPAAETTKAAPAKAATRKRAEQTVKVSTTRMDSLVTMVGELVIAQQMVVQDDAVETIADQRFQKNMGQVGKIIRDLQSVSMSLRMVTVKGSFQKMARIVRDVSAKANKKILFCMDGEDTELDRNVVEEIGDPLVHMIRNACDHGIEGPEERLAAGKTEEGTLTLRAYHQGGSIVIEVEDDGRGLNREKILGKAIERGLISADRDPADIPDTEVYNMVFLPGFSTADKVTDISGRGVGMDVVRKNIEALRGKAEITSAAGRGSIFRMRLPLTMAIIDGMVVRVGSQRYVLPTLAIEQSFQPTNEELSTSLKRGEMVSVRGSLLPIYRLNRVLKLNEGVDSLTDALLIVLESNDSRCCLVVDEILGQQQVVIKNLGKGVPTMRGVSGGAILGDGRVALILDVSGVVTEATSHVETEPAMRLAA